MGKIIVVTSGKGGVGKSTIATNLAYGLACENRRVLLVDMDTGLRSLDLMLGTENELVFDMTDVLDGICTWKNALFEVKQRPGLFLMPASQNSGSSAMTPHDIKAMLETLRDSFDFVILDCPAGIERGFRNSVAAAECAILVVTPDYISLRSGERAFQLLTGEGVQDIRLIVNRIGKRPPVRVDDCVKQLELPVLGYLPEDPTVARCTAAGMSALDVECPAGDAFERIVRRILGDDVPCRIPHEGILRRFGRKLRKDNR